MLPIRQYALMIDERELPAEFLTDGDTELGSHAALCFNGDVFNGTKRAYTPDGAEFANLREVNADFELRRGEGGRPYVAMLCHTAGVYWRMEADEEDRGVTTADHRVRRFRVGTFRELQWWRTYTFFQDLGEGGWRRMSVRVEPVRLPLRRLAGPPVGSWAPRRSAGGRENAYRN